MANLAEKNTSTSTGKSRDSEADILLSTLVKTSDRQDFIALFNYYAPKIKAYMARAGFTQEEADELAQETMLSIWRAHTKYDTSQASANTWVFTIARNKRIDALRKKIKPAPDSYELEMMMSQPENPEETSNRNEVATHITAILKKLPPEQSKLITLSYYQNMTHAEIAEQENLPLGTVKSRLRLALGKLKDAIEIDKDDG